MSDRLQTATMAMHRRWLTDEQWQKLADRRDDSIVRGILTTIEAHCHSERDLVDILIEGVFQLSRVNGHIRKQVMDLANLSAGKLMVISQAEIDRSAVE